MKINPIPTVSSLQLSKLGGATEAPSDQPKPNQRVAQAAPVTSPSPLTEETKKNLAFATQEIAPHGEHDHKVPPSQQARAAIAANPELAGLPFGQIVSALARGEPLPTVAVESQDDAEPVLDPVADNDSATPPLTEPPAETVGPTVDDLVVDVTSTTATTASVIDELLDTMTSPDAV